MRKFILLIVTVTLCHFAASPAFAESLSVSLQVGDTRVEFSGFTSPNAFITIKQNDSVIGTTLADSSGIWDKTIEVYNPGIQSFELFATDTHNLPTPTLRYDVNLAPNTYTTIGNIILPSTIAQDLTTSTIYGATSPTAIVTLMFSDSSTTTVFVGSDGSWLYNYSEMAPGSYSVYAVATLPGNYISLESQTISFTVSALASPSPSSSSQPSQSLIPHSALLPSTMPSPTITLSAPTIPPQVVRPSTSPLPPDSPAAPLSILLITVAKPVHTLLLLLIIIGVTKALLRMRHNLKSKSKKLK